VVLYCYCIIIIISIQSQGKKQNKTQKNKKNETTKELAATPPGGLYKNNKNLLFSYLQLDPNTPPKNNSKKIV